jgi:aminoglycoside 6'-N-acetyltransferase I
MDIVAFEHLTAAQRADCARILREAFTHVPAYDEDGDAEAEIETFLTVPERFAMAALDGETVLGFIGGIDTYSHAAELHPLAVDPAHHRKGVGAALTAALEARVAAMGKLTVYLGTDDEFGGTSLFGADIFPQALAKLADITPTNGHPFFFYRKLGYEAVGVVPDANGFGKPDLLMAKRVARP